MSIETWEDAYHYLKRKLREYPFANSITLPPETWDQVLGHIPPCYRFCRSNLEKTHFLVGINGVAFIRG
jgi:hypothetical protein